MDGRVNASDGVVLYTRGGTGNPAMKVLWTLRGGSGLFTVFGTRLDASGSFTQRFTGHGQVPSIVKIPVAGCWRLSVRSGSRRGAFVVRAVDAPADSFCEPSVVFRHTTPHPRFGDVAWMPTTPRSNGIAAVRFVSTLPGADRAVVYAGGLAPEGWSTKFLWWSPQPAGGVALDGWRLDGLGTFRQSFPAAASDDGTVYPSIVEIPTAGCWAVRVTIGPRTGLAVFNAVVTS